MTDFIYDSELIESLLEEAAEYGLLYEVVTFSLQYMKENPNSSVEEAVIYGYSEWVK